MLDYKDYEKQVYDWLMSKHNKDENFTFSLRQKGSKGAETDYFIGTEKSNYFSTTFWYLPVAFPGSSGDCMALVFEYTKTGYHYFFEFNQTKDPEDMQNQSALNLVQQLQAALGNTIGFQRQPNDKNKMFTLRTKTTKVSYDSLEEMFIDIEKDIVIILPIVDNMIVTVKKDFPDFKANRLTIEEFDMITQKHVERIKRFENIAMPEELIDDTVEEFTDIKPLEMVSQPLNQILYGPPGTGKTYNTINTAISIINPSFDIKQDREVVKLEYNRLVETGQILFTTFHQSMSYEDFIEGIKPETKNEKVTYDVIPGLFLRICDKAENNWEHAKQDNNEKLSFEDAFTLLKEEWFENEAMKFPLKREGNDYTIIGFTSKSIQFKKASGGTGHTLSIASLKKYYYQKEEIRLTGVGIYYPSILEKLNRYQPKVISEKELKNHVIIIDEINRGNVSAIFGELITLLEEDKRLGSDEALEVILPYSKDRFGVPSNLYIIGTMNTADRSVEALDTALRRRFSFTEMMPKPELLLDIQFDGFNLGEVLQTINDRIEILLDRDHAIGHSYFLKVESGDIESLKSVFKNSIFPLLQEYFYHDYEKIALILGSGFVEVKENRKVNFPKFNNLDAPEIGTQFKLIENIAAIENAVQLLLNRNV